MLVGVGSDIDRLAFWIDHIFMFRRIAGLLREQYTKRGRRNAHGSACGEYAVSRSGLWLANGTRYRRKHYGGIWKLFRQFQLHDGCFGRNKRVERV